MLHQRDSNDPNPCNWLVAFKPGGHTWRGLSKEDAFGAALDYIDQVGAHNILSQYACIALPGWESGWSRGVVLLLP